jgi:hypothetical protein
MELAPNAKRWIEELRKASEQFGKSMTIIGTLDEEMIKAGFVDVRRETRVVCLPSLSRTLSVLFLFS